MAIRDPFAGRPGRKHNGVIDAVKPVGEVIRLDLRGLKCPLNWAHAKVRLERMTPGEILELTLDDPRGAHDIPRAAEAEGYAIIETRAAAAGVWVLRIEK